MKIWITFIVCCFTATNLLKAQDGFVTTGGDVSNSNGSEAFSIGLVVYTEINGTGGYANQGVQHAFEIYVISVNENFAEFNLQVFPNPTSDQLIISASNEVNFDYNLMSLLGVKVNSGKLSGLQTTVNAAELPAGIYLLNIQQDSRIIKTYKIIKN